MARIASGPCMRTPMTYVIDYSGRFVRGPAEIAAYAGAPPDLMHVGKTVPITHNWGPVPLLWGENQSTCGPPGGKGLNRDGIRLLTPDELAERIRACFGCTHEEHLVIPENVG